jgi:hypothetical protein
MRDWNLLFDLKARTMVHPSRPCAKLLSLPSKEALRGDSSGGEESSINAAVLQRPFDLGPSGICRFELLQKSDHEKWKKNSRNQS